MAEAQLLILFSVIVINEINACFGQKGKTIVIVVYKNGFVLTILDFLDCLQVVKVKTNGVLDGGLLDLTPGKKLGFIVIENDPIVTKLKAFHLSDLALSKIKHSPFDARQLQFEYKF